MGCRARGSKLYLRPVQRWGAEQSTRPDDTALRDRLKSLALERRRFGYRRLHVLLRRDGHAVNHKCVQRLYREEKLTVRRRGGRKRALGERRPLETPTAANLFLKR
jgi:putative transposase